MRAVSLLGLFIFAICGTSFSAHAEPLSFTIASRDPISNKNSNGFLDQIIKEMFSGLGIEAKVTFYPSSARGLKNANLGIDDGVGLRVKGLEKKFPNLIRIPESIITNSFVAISTKYNVVTDDWHSLDENYIAHILGWQIFQKNLTHHKKTSKVRSNEQLFNLLAKDRVDFILHERWQAAWHAKQLNLNINIQDPPLAKREMFAYIHNKHAPIVDKAAASLAEMKADGTYQKIVDSTLSILLSKTQ